MLKHFTSLFLNPLVDWYQLARLQRQRSQVSKDRDNMQMQLIAEGLPKEEAIFQAAQRYKNEFRGTQSAIAVFLSDRMVKQAERLQVPVPYDEKYWVMLKYADHMHLSEEGVTILRQRVREEKKARREVTSYWFTVITTLLSLLVAILALRK